MGILKKIMDILLNLIHNMLSYSNSNLIEITVDPILTEYGEKLKFTVTNFDLLHMNEGGMTSLSKNERSHLFINSNSNGFNLRLFLSECILKTMSGEMKIENSDEDEMKYLFEIPLNIVSYYQRSEKILNKNIKILCLNSNTVLKDFFHIIKNNYSFYETFFINDLEEYDERKKLEGPFDFIILNIEFNSNNLDNVFLADMKKHFDGIPIIYITHDETGYIDRNLYEMTSNYYRLNFPFDFSEFEYLLKLIFDEKVHHFHA